MSVLENAPSSVRLQAGPGMAVSDVARLVARPRVVVLIDPTTITRECLRHMLDARAGRIHVEAAAASAECSTQHPDLVLLNIRSTRVDDGSVRVQLDNIRRRFGDAPIVLIADLDSHELAIQAFRHNVRGYVPTSMAREVVIAAIDLVLAGGTFVPEQMIARYREVPSQDLSDPVTPAAEDPRLTSRESDVLQRLRQGKPNKIIAYELRISESTVKVHVRNMMKKLSATNRTQVAFLTHSVAAREAVRPAGDSGAARLKTV